MEAYQSFSLGVAILLVALLPLTTYLLIDNRGSESKRRIRERHLATLVTRVTYLNRLHVFNARKSGLELPMAPERRPGGETYGPSPPPEEEPDGPLPPPEEEPKAEDLEEQIEWIKTELKRLRKSYKRKFKDFLHWLNIPGWVFGSSFVVIWLVSWVFRWLGRGLPDASIHELYQQLLAWFGAAAVITFLLLLLVKLLEKLIESDLEDTESALIEELERKQEALEEALQEQA